MKILTMLGLPVEGAAIRHMLINNPHNVFCDDQEFSPEDGMRKIAVNRPDLLLILLDGREEAALSFIKNVREKYSRIHMIAMSSRENFYLLQKAVRLGCSDYLLKPCNAGTLNEAVNRIFEKTEASDRDSGIGQGNCAQLKQELINEILYSEEGRPREAACAWLEAVYAENGELAQQEMIDFTFTLKHLLEWMSGDFQELEGEQKKVITAMNLNLVSRLYESGEREEACRAFADYTESFAKMCRAGSFSNSYKLVEMSKKVIERRMDQKLSLEMVASEIYISPFYLCRIFKKHVGENFSDYVIDTKIREAKKLLLFSGETIDEIAHRVGYDEPNSFRRIFKKRVGVSPGSYRSRAAASPLRPQEM